jgi:hypothetical protein
MALTLAAGACTDDSILPAEFPNARAYRPLGAVKARAGVFGPRLSNHFYSLARSFTASQPWPFPSILPNGNELDTCPGLDHLLSTDGVSVFADASGGGPPWVSAKKRATSSCASRACSGVPSDNA